MLHGASENAEEPSAGSRERARGFGGCCWSPVAHFILLGTIHSIGLGDGKEEHDAAHDGYAKAKKGKAISHECQLISWQSIEMKPWGFLCRIIKWVWRLDVCNNVPSYFHDILFGSQNQSTRLVPVLRFKGNHYT